MQEPFLGGLTLQSNVTYNGKDIWPMHSSGIKGTLFFFFFHQMIVQIEFLAHPCLFERNLKAVITLSLVTKHDIFKPCVNVESFRKIRLSALPGL